MILFKGSPRTVLLFYALSLLIAIFIAQWSFVSGYKSVPEGNKPSTAGIFFASILLFTALFLVLAYILKQLLRFVIFALELFFLFSTAFLLFSALLNEVAALLWSLLIVLLRMLFPNVLFFRNLSVSIISGVSSGLVGASLAPQVALLLYIALVIYDFVSVFLTGHMVKLVESVENIRAKGYGTVVLGAGDVVLPAIFSTSFVFSLPLMVVAALGAVFGVALTFYCLKRFRRPLPALPYISAVQLTVTALSLFLSMAFL